MIENDWTIRLSSCKCPIVLRSLRNISYENRKIRFLKFTHLLNNQLLSLPCLDLRIQLLSLSLTTTMVIQNLFKLHSKFQKSFKFKEVTTGMIQWRVKNLNRLLLHEKKLSMMKVWSRIQKAQYRILIWLENGTKAKRSTKASWRIQRFKKFSQKPSLSVRMTLLK